MLTKKHYAELLNTYEQTRKGAQRLAFSLEEASMLISASGEGFTRRSALLITDANDLCASLKVFVNDFESLAEVEK